MKCCMVSYVPQIHYLLHRVHLSDGEQTLFHPISIHFESNNLFSFFKLFYCCSITVVCIFSPTLPPQPQPNLPPSLGSTLPLGFVHVSFIVVPSNPSPHYPTSPLVTVRLFLISMSLVIFWLLFSFDE